MSLTRVSAMVLSVGFAWAALAAPAWAHVKVEANPSQAGAAKAQLTFRAAAESKTAGIIKLEFLADPAIPRDLVALVGGPVGWKVRPGDFGGFIVEGAALPIGDDAKVTLEARQLPQARRIVFKVLQTYSDGRIDRWTDLPAADGKEPDHPVAILELDAATPKAATTPSAPPKAAPTPSLSAPSPAPAPSAAASPGEKREPEVAGKALARTGSGTRWLALAGGLLLVTGGAGIGMGAGRRRPG